MNVLIDIDGTLVIDHHWQTLRPGTEVFLTELREQGHKPILWSRRGSSHCLKIAKRFPIERLVHGFATKPYKRDIVRWQLMQQAFSPENRELHIHGLTYDSTALSSFTFYPDCCVDNSGVHLLQAFGGFRVPTYKAVEDSNTQVFAIVADHIAKGKSFQPYIDIRDYFK